MYFSQNIYRGAKMSRFITFIATLLSLSCFAAPKIGFFSEEMRYGETWQKFGAYQDLKAEGLIGNAEKSTHFIFGGVTEEDIYKKLSAYHAVVISLDRCFRNLDYATTSRNYRNALKRYVQNGGGIVLVAQNGEYIQDKRVDAFNIMFKDFGINLLKEGINDFSNEFLYQNHPFLSVPRNADPAYLHFFKTANIAKTPITDGVKNLFFPLWGNGGMWATLGMELSKDWQIAVRGEKTACSYSDVSKAAKNSRFVKKGKISSEPALVAYRNYGKGRIVAISGNLMHLTLNLHAADWPLVFEKNGDGKTASDGLRLFINSLKYVAENGQKNPQFGTFKEKKYVNRLINAPLNFDNARFRKPQTQFKKGIIGLHSSYSDGSGSVAEYAAAAKKAGLDFIVFTESFEKLTADKLNKLKRECKKFSDKDLYICPGIEFNDINGIRWAFWGESVVYPDPTMLSKDKKSIEWWGQYNALCNRGPSAILNYDRLHKLGEPSNLWWYFRVPVKITRKGVSGKVDLSEYLFALQDLRAMANFGFNGIYSPDKLAAAGKKDGLNVIPGNFSHVKRWLNSKNSYDCGLGYFSEGPEIRLWQGINADSSIDFAIRKGWQRVRMKFDVASDAGIKEVKIWDGTNGIFRRFNGKGAKNFNVEFEGVHANTKHLVLEVIDMQGKRAVSPELEISNPFYAMYRCSDNLNLLGYSTLLMHPPQHEIPSMRMFEDTYSGNISLSGRDKTTILGVDVGIPFLFQPQASVNFNLFTSVGNQYGGSITLDNFNAVKARYPMNSEGVSILENNSTKRVDTKKRHKPTRRYSFCMYSFFPLSGEQPIADIEHTSYLLRSRIKPTLRFTKPWLAEDDYRGGIMIHNIKFRFKKDVTLKGDVPVRLATVNPGSIFFRAKWGYNNTIVAETPEKMLVLPVGKYTKGNLKNGGFVTVLSQKSQRRVLLLPYSNDSEVCFYVNPSGEFAAGIGKHGQKVKKGDTMSVTLIVAAQTNSAANAAECQKLASALINGPELAVKIGKTEKMTGFSKIAAKDGEVEFSLNPVYSICDAPFVISGIADNGCSAYYEKDKGFIFAPVLKNEMYFQTAADKQQKIWAGNIFLASNPDLKLTMIIDGQKKGKAPYMKIHNPTEKEIKAKVWSPANTPVFGGKSFNITIPALSSVKQNVN